MKIRIRKNLRITFLCGLACLMFIYSCKKFLDKQPTGSLSGSVLASKAGLDGLLIGAYSMLDGYYSGQSGDSWRGSSDNWVWGGIASDDAYKGSNTTDQPDAAPIENHTIEPSNSFLQTKWAVFMMLFSVQTMLLEKYL